MQVRKAAEALEAVLKYKADRRDTLDVDAQMMPLLIGKGGEEITGSTRRPACIDAERDEKPPVQAARLQGRGREGDARCSRLSTCNKRVGEHVPLPWRPRHRRAHRA